MLRVRLRAEPINDKQTKPVKMNLMKRILVPMSLLLLFGTAACSHHRIIPNDELAAIFRDVYLTNAYVAKENLRTDSLNLYQPIFERYGYTPEDVERTVESFSKRKSARLSDVVEAAIALLDREGEYYQHEVAVLDTIANVSCRSLYRTVYADTLIRARRLADSTLLRIELDSLRAGEYRVSAEYFVDSLDRNPGMRGAVWTELEDGTRRNMYSYLLRRSVDGEFTRSLEVDTSMKRLVVSFIEFTRPRERKRLSVTVRNLKIEYTPPVEEAIDSFFHRQVDVRIFADEFLGDAFRTKDSL